MTIVVLLRSWRCADQEPRPDSNGFSLIFTFCNTLLKLHAILYLFERDHFNLEYVEKWKKVVGFALIGENAAGENKTLVLEMLQGLVENINQIVNHKVSSAKYFAPKIMS